MGRSLPFLSRANLEWSFGLRERMMPFQIGRTPSPALWSVWQSSPPGSPVICEKSFRDKCWQKGPDFVSAILRAFSDEYFTTLPLILSSMCGLVKHDDACS